ncbi:hypothetical protein [Thalassotalea litorea]|uniref:hypothetical protein n=1 Tax=Thalassotalea litorea TaxID=2020715 RepID=UPI003736DAFF
MIIKTRNPGLALLSLSVLSFGLCSVATSAAEKAFEQEIEIIKKSGSDANVTVSENGKTTTLLLSEAAIKDKKALQKELAKLPEETQKVVMDALNNVSVRQTDKGEAKVLTWIEKDGEEEIELTSADKVKGKVVVIEKNVGSDGAEADVKIIKKMVSTDTDGEHAMFISADSKSGAAEAIVHLLKKADLSADELEQIQQALDSKK